MKKTFLYISTFVVMALLLVFLNAQMRRTAAAELALTEGTLSAVSEASAELSQLTLSMEKLLVSASPEHAASFLADVVLRADRVQRSISALPDLQGERADIQTFLSTLADRATALLTSLVTGVSISDADRAELTEMLSGLRLLQSEVALAQQSLLLGMRLPEALPRTEITAKPTAQELAAYKALPAGEVSLGNALQIAKEFVGLERVTSVSHAPDTTGALPADGVTVQTADVQLNLEVTRQGGKVLLMVPETASFPVRQTVDTCRAAALAFLARQGLPRMEAPWYQVYDGLCVLTCVFVEQDVLIWPDRVLVQVRMDTGEVVGIETRSFWKNHLPRRLDKPLLSETEARASLSPSVSVEGSRLCLLPHDGQERLCYQFALTHQGDAYIAYIDAITGQELLLEKVMQLEMGAVAA